MPECDSKYLQGLRKCALRQCDVVERPSCSNQAFYVGKKAFAYLGEKPAGLYLMVKLDDSLADAAKMEARHPDQYQVGKHGWVTVRLPFGARAPKGLLEGWIEESYRAFSS